MAQQFGGKFSPNAAPSAPATGAPKTVRAKAGFRTWLLFVAPLPLIFTGFGNVTAANPSGILRDFGAFVVLILAAWLLREGLKAEAAFNNRKSARKPAFPRKVFASVLTGVGVGLALTGGSGSMIVPPLLGLLATGLHLFSFGLDPMRDKGIDSIDALSDRRVARAVDEAETYITAMVDALAVLKDRDLQKRMNSFITSARDMFRSVQEDPRDLVAARKYLSVYLIGARDATVKFVDLYKKTGDTAARTSYEGLLADLETNFTTQRQEMLLDDRSDLDVEIDVLRERLSREGVRAK